MSGSQLRLEFVESMRSNPAARRKVFEYFCREDEGRRFADGQAGLQLYQTLLQCVTQVGAAEAIKEFKEFFLPRLDQNLLTKTTLDIREALRKVEKSTSDRQAASPAKKVKSWWRSLMA